MFDKYQIASKLWHSVVPSLLLIAPITLFLRDSLGMSSKSEYLAYIYIIVVVCFGIFSTPLSKMSRWRSFGIGMIGAILITIIVHVVAAII